VPLLFYQASTAPHAYQVLMSCASLQAVDGAVGKQLQAAYVDGRSIAAGELLGSRRAFDGLTRVSRPGACGAPVYELRLAC
jgi:hypothetical protein